MKGTRSGGPHELITILDPGTRKPRTRAAAASASGSKMIPKRDSAASKLSDGKFRLAAWASTNSTFPRPAAPALAAVGQHPGREVGGHDLALGSSHGRAVLEAARVRVLLADGAGDPVPVPGRTSELVARHPNITTATHPTARHELPITHPSWCVNRLASPHDHDDERTSHGQTPNAA